MRTIENKEKVQKLKKTRRNINAGCLATALSGSAIGIATAASGALLNLPVIQIILLLCSILPLAGMAISNAVISNQLKKYYNYDMDVTKSFEPTVEKIEQPTKQANVSVVKFDKPKAETKIKVSENEPEIN